MRELVVDNFAGGGGASTGIRMALGHDVDIAINHDESAIAMHKVNHPTAVHYQEDVWQIDPIKACAGRPVGLAWFSPDCKHFSKAKGGKPCDKHIRGLAWVAVRWAKAVRPRVIMMENVEEIQTWGPLLPNGKPDPTREGQTYRRFIRSLENLGYHVETNELVAADFGAPTTRKRWFMIARCDGQPIRWPSPTHLPRREFGTMIEYATSDAKPWRPVADVIDWSLPCPSIFESKAEIRGKYGLDAVRPLAENTLKRIARGVQRFVLENPSPFIVTVNHSGDSFRGQGIDEPLPTVTAKHGYGVVTPFLASIGQTGAGDGRSRGCDEPLRTIVSKNESCLCTPVLMRNNENAVGASPREPLQTVTDGGHHMVIMPSLIQYHQERVGEESRGQDVRRPLLTQDASNRYALVSAFLHKYYDGGYTGAGSDLREPAPTVTAIDHNSLACAFLTQFNNNCVGQPPTEPINTITAGIGHFGEVRAFLMKYYGTHDSFSDCGEPMPTQTTKDRFGLVTIYGTDYCIVDIGLRMLTPRELFDAQGFPHDYEIVQGADGRVLTKAEQVARCGNAVPPQLAEALVRANLPDMCEEREAV